MEKNKVHIVVGGTTYSIITEDDPDYVTDLAESIKAQGVKQNLLVVPYTESTGPNETRQVYRVVIGHRRLAAAKQAGLGSLPCKVEVLTEREEREIMILENTQRSDLKPIEE